MPLLASSWPEPHGLGGAAGEPWLVLAAVVTIYLVRGSQRMRLGTAGGLKQTTLTIPATVVFGSTPLRFLADPIGAGRGPASDEITVRAGDQVSLIIPP